MMVLDVLVSRCLAALVLDHTETECYSVGGKASHFMVTKNQKEKLRMRNILQGIQQ